MAYKHRSEPRWDNSRNVSAYGRRLYKVNASSLKHVGVIYAATPVTDSNGNYTFTLSKRSDTWMAVKMLKIVEVFEYRGKNVQATHMVTVRGEIPVFATDNIHVSGMEFEVVHVDYDQDRGLYKTILCKEML